MTSPLNPFRRQTLPITPFPSPPPTWSPYNTTAAPSGQALQTPVSPSPPSSLPLSTIKPSSNASGDPTSGNPNSTPKTLIQNFTIRKILKANHFKADATLRTLRSLQVWYRAQAANLDQWPFHSPPGDEFSQSMEFPCRGRDGQVRVPWDWDYQDTETETEMETQTETDTERGKRIARIEMEVRREEKEREKRRAWTRRPNLEFLTNEELVQEAEAWWNGEEKVTRKWWEQEGRRLHKERARWRFPFPKRKKKEKGAQVGWGVQQGEWGAQQGEGDKGKDKIEVVPPFPVIKFGEMEFEWGAQQGGWGAQQGEGAVLGEGGKGKDNIEVVCPFPVTKFGELEVEFSWGDVFYF